MDNKYEVLKTRKDALNALCRELGVERKDPNEQYITRDECVEALKAVVELKGAQA